MEGGAAIPSEIWLVDLKTIESFLAASVRLSPRAKA